MPVRTHRSPNLSALLRPDRQCAAVRRAAALMRQRTDLISAIADNAPGLLAYWTRALCCTFSNPPYQQWLGRSAKQLLGLSMRELLGEAQFRQIEPHVRAALAGQRQQFEHLMIAADGRVRPSCSQYIPHRVDGQVRGFFVLISDLSGLLQEQEKLRRSEAFNTAILDSLTDTIAVLDQQGTIVAVNEAWRRFARANAARTATVQGVGINYLELCVGGARGEDETDSSAARAGILAVLDGQQATFELEYPCHAPHQQRWFHLGVSRLLGAMPGAVVAHRDITQSRLAADRLRLSEENLAVTLQSIGDGVIATDALGHITRMNPAAERLTGWSVKEAAGRSLAEVYGVFESQPHPEQGRSDHVMLLARDGLEHHIADTAAPIRGANGQVLGTVLVFSDVTESYHVQEALRSSLKEKEALLNEVHHRVKNNLQVVTSLLRLEAGRSAEPAARAVLGDMQGRIRSMALLHESLYRSGSFAEVDLGAYLRNLATQAFRSLLTGPGAIALQLDLASVKVSLDQAMPCGLLVNELISNCLKHAFPAGRSGMVRVELMAAESHLILRVADDGVGMPADLEARREDSLGLQLAADLAGQIGGRLEIGTGPGSDISLSFVAAAIRPATDDS